MNWLPTKAHKKAVAAGMMRPLARTDEVVVEQVGDEVLIYDQRTPQAHCLGSVAASVWRASDGNTRVAAIAAQLDVDVATVMRAIGELESCELLQTSPMLGVTRRDVTARMMKAGAVVAAAPLIYSIAAPTPALAASEKFCLALCPGGCGGCSNAGCCCCSPGGGTNKVCAIDCAHCNSEVLNQSHCGEILTSVPCSSGC